MPKAKRATTSRRAAKGSVTLATPKDAGAARPPRKGAPPATFPVGASTASQQLAPAPLVDRYPLVVGQSLSVSYLSQCMRLATTGYRLQLVDLLRELVEHDPHLFSVIQKRILSVANGRLEIVAAELPAAHPDRELATEVADMVRTELARIPGFTQARATLLWAIYYAASCAEIMWSRDSDGWHVDRLEFVHTRRLGWPESQSWDAYIWDQGQVLGWGAFGTSPTNKAPYGLRLADYPGKFIFYAPQLAGDYPTRDGLGRQVAVWAVFKRLGVRGAVDYLERFATGFMDVSYATQADGKPREATDDDIATANTIARALGPGSGSCTSHPDSITINPKSFDGGSAAKLTWPEWIQVCNGEQSKLVLGGTLGTEVGRGGGNRALGEVQERGEVDLEQYDATTLAETLRRDLVTWIVRLNRPEALHVVPGVLIHVDTDPDPKTLLGNALVFTKMGAPVDLDDLSDKVGIKLVDNPNPEKPRQAFVSDVLDPSEVDPDLLSEEAKQQQADATAAQQALAQAKAQQQSNPPPNDGSGQAGKEPAEAGKGKEPEPKTPPGKEPGDDEKQDRELADHVRVLLKDRPDGGAAQAVFDQLLEDYPAKSLGWVLAANWRGPMMVPLADIDFSNRDKWTASHDGKLQSYIDKRRRDGGENVKPAVMVKSPGNPKILPVDGHHRTLAAESENEPVRAYVATMQVDRGPWLELHALQRKGSGEASYASYSSYFDRKQAV